MKVKYLLFERGEDSVHQTNISATFNSAIESPLFFLPFWQIVLQNSITRCKRWKEEWSPSAKRILFLCLTLQSSPPSVFLIVSPAFGTIDVVQADWEQAKELPTSDGRNEIGVWWQQIVKGRHEATHNLWRLKCHDKFLPTWDISHFVV